jgi:hypothetical protein
MSTLQLASSLQFLSLSGNKLNIYSQTPKNEEDQNLIEEFNYNLIEFIKCNTNSLTHLNLSDMVNILEKSLMDSCHKNSIFKVL